MSTGPTESSLESEIENLRAELARLQKRFSESQERLHAVFETVVEGIITIDDHGAIDTANEAAGRLFGYRRDEMIGKNVNMLMPDPYHREHDGYLQNYLRTREPKIIGIGREVVGKKKDGSTFPLYLSVSEVRFNDRTMFTGFVQDLTERKAHQEKEAQWREELERKVEQRTAELALANQELENFTYTISHDLRTPLRGIRNYVDFLKEDLQDHIKGESMEDLQRLGQAADELELMVHELLEYSRIGRSELEPEEVKIDELIGSIRSALGLAATENIVVEGELPSICAPHGLLRQIFQNLIENGLRYNTSEVREVRISASPSTMDSKGKRGWVFRVSDNGIGIDAPYHEKVFGMFQRLHSQKDYAGTGIGLAAVRKAVHFLNGRIELSSEPGKGTLFRIELPERPARPISTDCLPPESPSPGS